MLSAFPTFRGSLVGKGSESPRVKLQEGGSGQASKADPSASAMCVFCRLNTRSVLEMGPWAGTLAVHYPGR